MKCKIPFPTISNDGIETATEMCIRDRDKDGTVANTLKGGQEVVVQIVKEPISTKGPRLTSEISFAGRYLVPVSYTHLDVYKRQEKVLSFAIDGPIAYLYTYDYQTKDSAIKV